MNAALIYRTNSRWLIWLAFACAILLHVAAIALAENKSRPLVTDFGSFEPDVIGIVDDQSASPPEQDVDLPAEPIPTMADDEAFPQENATPPPIRVRKKTPITPLVRSLGIGTGRAMNSGSVKALTLYAPRPNYPYEARRGGITGSGIAHLTVNSETGNVIDARMTQTTGNTILDNVTVETLRRWRFKPGVASNIDVPITYTLMGVSY